MHLCSNTTRFQAQKSVEAAAVLILAAVQRLVYSRTQLPRCWIGKDVALGIEPGNLSRHYPQETGIALAPPSALSTGRRADSGVGNGLASGNPQISYRRTPAAR
jgi:hypothetical protein